MRQRGRGASRIMDEHGLDGFPKQSFKLIDEYVRKQHLCFLAEMFLNRGKTEYILCFRPTEAANNPDRYACRYLQFETSMIWALEQASDLNDPIKALLDQELKNLNTSS
jgi:hypothetical protein